MGKRTKKLLLTMMALLVLSILANVWLISSQHDRVTKTRQSIDSLNEQILRLRQDSAELSSKYSQTNEKGVEIRENALKRDEEWAERLERKSNETDSLKQEIDKLKKENGELRESTSPKQKTSNTPIANHISTVKRTLSQWISSCDKGNLIKGTDIDALIKNNLEQHNREQAIREIITVLRKAKSNVPWTQKKNFQNALNKLNKYKN